MKLDFDVRDRCRRDELAIGVQDEQIARPVEDDAAARPVFVFVRPHEGAQGAIDSFVAAPMSPSFVVAGAVGQTIAIRLGLIQRTTGGEQPRFASWRLHQPENSDVRRRARSFFGHAVTMPFARRSYFASLPS